MTADPSYDWIRTRMRELGAGTISPDDKLRLEQIAQGDPFVADALEGYAAVPAADHAAHLDRIASHIHQPRRQRRRWLIPNLTVTAIAAVFMILVGTWAVVRWSGQPAEESRVVILSTDTLQAADTITPAATASAKSDTTGNDQAVAATRMSDQPASMTAQPESGKSSRPVLPGTSGSTISGPMPAVSATRKEDARAKGAGTAARLYDLYVYAEDSLARNVPAEYTVFLIPTTQRIRPDRTGVAKGLVPDAEIAPYLVNDYGAYGQRTYSAYAGNSMWPLRFPPSLPGKDERETTLAIPSPVNGYPAFINALHGRTTFPFENNLKHSTYSVTLAFRIDKRGRPEQLTSAEDNVPAEYVNEAKRLLLDGPDWTCPNGQQGCMARFTFFFRKPAQ